MGGNVLTFGCLSLLFPPVQHLALLYSRFGDSRLRLLGAPAILGNPPAQAENMVLGKSSVLLLAAAGLVAGARQESRTGAQASLEVAWSGKDHGKLSGPATARWCAARRVVEIALVKGDSGIAIALYPARTLVPGTYPVLEPDRAESLPPAAAIALRWLGSTVVQGFRADTGRIVVQRSAAGLFSGRLGARARSVVDTQRITLSGTFEDLALARDSLGCTARTDSAEEAAERPDTGVH